MSIFLNPKYVERHIGKFFMPRDKDTCLSEGYRYALPSDMDLFKKFPRKYMQDPFFDEVRWYGHLPPQDSVGTRSLGGFIVNKWRAGGIIKQMQKLGVAHSYPIYDPSGYRLF